MSRTFTREEFHELVWSKPMTHLAKEFALSDVALHKICRKHDIPSPPAGWWAKKAAGKAVKVAPLPAVKGGALGRLTIAAPELRAEPGTIAMAREAARVRASTVLHNEATPHHPIIKRTIERLGRAKPDAANGMVSTDGVGLVKVRIAPSSLDRLKLALDRIVAAAAAVGIGLAAGAASAVFESEGETIGFSIEEALKREKRILTEREQAADAAWQRKRQQRVGADSWASLDFDLSRPQMPEWDHKPTGLLSFELAPNDRARRLRIGSFQAIRP